MLYQSHGMHLYEQCMIKRHAEMVELFNETSFTKTLKHKFKTIETKQKSNVEILKNRCIPKLKVLFLVWNFILDITFHSIHRLIFEVCDICNCSYTNFLSHILCTLTVLLINLHLAHLGDLSSFGILCLLVHLLVCTSRNIFVQEL